MALSKKRIRELHSPREIIAVLTVTMILVVLLGADSFTGNAVAGPPKEPDMILWFLFGNNLDGSGNGNDAQWSKVSSKSFAANFLGTKDNFIFVEKMKNFPMKAITASFWMHSGAVSRKAGFISYAASSSPDEFLIFYDVQNLELYIGGERIRLTSPTDTVGKKLYDNQWHHVVVTWDSVSGIAQWYLDGKRVGKDAFGKKGHSLLPEGTAVFGQDQDCQFPKKCRFNTKSDATNGGFGNSQAYFGNLANLRIYNTVKSPQDIALLAKQVPPPVVVEEKKK